MKYNTSDITSKIQPMAIYFVLNQNAQKPQQKPKQ